MLTRTGDIIEPISLAHAAPFRLGTVDVCPATRQLISGGSRETLEPRVMQVLVALAQAKGGVVTRDELTDLCWEGRIVSENAINRVISRLRQVAADFAGGAFQIETITKVGYRIVTNDVTVSQPGETRNPDPSPSRTRRGLLIGAAGAVAAAGLGGWWLRERSGAPVTAALELYRKGNEARNQGWIDLIGQAEAYFRQAVEIDPSFAEAWAALALAYATQVHLAEQSEQEPLAARAEAAARRALALDPESVQARTALTLVPAEYRRWAESQAALRGLIEAGPSESYIEWVLRSRLAYSLGEVGRSREALAESRRAAALNPHHPGTSSGLHFALWAAGELNEAEAVSEQGVRRWPRHPGTWYTRLAFLTFSGRPAAAVAFAGDITGRPANAEEELVARRIATAQALATRTPRDIEHAIGLHLKRAAQDAGDMPASMRFFAALDRHDMVFDLADAYFSNSGPLALPNRLKPSRYTRYDVLSLFWPPMARIRQDSRFTGLSQRIGLASYWHQSGSVPDFRRLQPA